MVQTKQINISTEGNTDIVNITGEVQEAIRESGICNGIAVVINIGSTAGITTTEYEPGLATYDLKHAFEKIAPENGYYKHEETWNDDNGHSHVRASLLGPSVSVPVIDSKPALGTWQQIILVDFDTRPRERSIVCQIVGE